MSKARVGTIWLDGCSGCHMSFSWYGWEVNRTC